MIEKITDNIYTFPIVLPRNPLQYLNCYIIKATDGGRDLLIDTGFKRPECWKALRAGMEELGIRPENTDVFLTHFHSDHSGNVSALYKLGSRILAGAIDINELDRSVWPLVTARYRSEGMLPHIVDAFYEMPSIRYLPDEFESTLVNDGDILEYGGHKLKCLLTPGHSLGHLCLYDEENQILFSGDTLLYDITPNITCRCERRDMLHMYLESLKKLLAIDPPPRFVLTGHRRCGELELRCRAEELIAHHTERLDEALEIVYNCPGLTAYDITGHMQWRISAKSWDKFPDNQKWFAMGECMAHLDYLVIENLIRQDEKDGLIYYYPVER